MEREQIKRIHFGSFQKEKFPLLNYMIRKCLPLSFQGALRLQSDKNQFYGKNCIYQREQQTYPVTDMCEALCEKVPDTRKVNFARQHPISTETASRHT